MSIETGQQISIWSVRISLGFWFLFALFRVQNSHGQNSLRWTFTLATLLHIVHVVLAFACFHDWSHQLAMEHTAARTAEFTGVTWGGGIWFNHLFMIVCLIETFLWWFSPKTIQTRSRVVNLIVYSFLAFMILNAGVVFVSGWSRWINLAGFICVAVVALIASRNTRASQNPGQQP